MAQAEKPDICLPPSPFFLSLPISNKCLMMTGKEAG